MNPVLDFSERVAAIPVVHGSGFFAREVRRRLRAEAFACVALPLPPSFAGPVEAGVARLPRVAVALQAELDPSGTGGAYNYVPVDPCQAVIAAVREAAAAGIPCAWIDLEVAAYDPPAGLVLPDPFPLPQTGLEAFAAACLPVLPRPQAGSQHEERVRHMAHQLHRLELDYPRVACVCCLADWPWVRQAYRGHLNAVRPFGGATLPELVPVAEESLYFVLGELPYLTFLHEHRRAEEMGVAFGGGSAEVIDGVKALVLEARDRMRREGSDDPDGGAAQQAASLTPQRLRLLLQYARNRTLLGARMTPELYDLVQAARQVVGDDYALSLIRTAREYPPQRIGPPADGALRMDFERIVDGDGHVCAAKNRLAGVPRQWRNLTLRPTPPAPLRQRWRLEWDPFGQCSYPPEDARIESFQQHVRDQARALLGFDLPRVEKFTASLMDGLDLRETLRNWHTGDLYVKQMPPTRGGVEVVVFLFEVPADPDRYRWRSTWYAEHEEESTLCFFATPHTDQLVGPGIGQAVYGGCFFVFPPRPIPDVWTDPRLDGHDRLEERLLAGACLHSRERRVVLVAPQAPSPRWRRLARQLGRQLVYLPLRRFGTDTVARLRRFHVLNGRQVRAYAARYIRPPR